MSDDVSLDLRDGGTGGGPAKISYKNVSGTVGSLGLVWLDAKDGGVPGGKNDTQAVSMVKQLTEIINWKGIWFVGGNSEF